MITIRTLTLSVLFVVAGLFVVPSYAMAGDGADVAAKKAALKAKVEKVRKEREDARKLRLRKKLPDQRIRNGWVEIPVWVEKKYSRMSHRWIPGHWKWGRVARRLPSTRIEYQYRNIRRTPYQVRYWNRRSRLPNPPRVILPRRSSSRSYSGRSVFGRRSGSYRRSRGYRSGTTSRVYFSMRIR